MKAVIQEEISGCAIASSAAIAGLSYTEAKKIANRLGIRAEDPALWSDTRHIRTLLRRLGFDTGRRETPFRSWGSLPDCALLATKWHRHGGKPFWHWVVFSRDGEREVVLDSKKGLKRNVRTDFGRVKPKWYITVHARRR